MKKTFLFLSGILFFVSCDKVRLPNVPKTTVVGSNFIKNSNASVSKLKKTLLEDYTGHRCVNCARAASTIRYNLLPQPQNELSLIVISVHQGDLAAPFGKEFVNDFRTKFGDAWGGSARLGVDTWPTGFINRKNYNSNGLKLSDTKWTSVVPLALSDRFVIRLNFSTEYDSTVRALNVFVKGIFAIKYPNPVKLCAVFIEDDLTGPQDDLTLGKIEDFEFEHVVRGDINGVAGVDLTTTAAAAKDTASWSIVGFKLPEYTTNNKLANGNPIPGQTINHNNVSVVVFAYDAVTNEVLQAEKLKITESVEED